MKYQLLCICVKNTQYHLNGDVYLCETFVNWNPSWWASMLNDSTKMFVVVKVP